MSQHEWLISSAAEVGPNPVWISNDHDSIRNDDHDDRTGLVSQIGTWKTDTVPEDLTSGVMDAITGAGLQPSQTTGA